MKLPKLIITRSGEDVMVTIVPSEGAERVPADLCCVVDISSSMRKEATMKREVGGEEVGDGLSQMDVVKHCLKTIIRSMSAEDRLSLVVFSTTARVVFSLEAMDDAGQARALAQVEGLRSQGTTNLWDGLYKGLEAMREGLATAVPGCARQVLLLTDGQPNVIPPRGHLPMLQVYKEENDGSFPCSIQTFGFGTDLDSDLLDKIAAEGNGHFAFIRDSSYVGTCFINALANLQTTISCSVKVSLEGLNGAVLEEVKSYPHIKTSWGAVVQPGPLQFGQPRNILCRLSNIPDDAPFLGAHLDLEVPEPVRVSAESGVFSEIEDDPEVEIQMFRLMEVDLMHELVATGKARGVGGLHQTIDALVAQMRESPHQAGDSPHEYVSSLVEDLTTRIPKSVTGIERFRRWGQHYLRSLARAHLLQASTNFREAGLQKYGGVLFRRCQRGAEKIFMSLPPPVATLPASSARSRPTMRSTRSTGSSSRASASASASRASPTKARPAARPRKTAPVQKRVSMDDYYDAGGPCVAGWCNVRMFDGSDSLVKDVRKKDIVLSASGSPAEVLCVIKTMIPSGQRELVNVPGTGLWLTPKHPIRIRNVWMYPKDIAAPVIQQCEATYSFVLQSEHVMLIEGVEVVSFGDRSELDSPVVKHPFYGTSAIVEELSGMRGWEKGLVELVDDACVVRSRETDKICGFRQ